MSIRGMILVELSQVRLEPLDLVLERLDPSLQQLVHQAAGPFFERWVRMLVVQLVVITADDLCS